MKNTSKYMSAAVNTARPFLLFAGAVALSSLYPTAAYADLPTLPEPPSDLGGEDGDWLKMIGRALLRFGGYIIIAIILAAAATASWAIVHEVNKYREGRAGGGEVAITILVSIVGLAFVCVIGLWVNTKILQPNQGYLGG